MWHSASRVHATVPAPDAHAGASTGCTHMGGSASCCHPFPFPCATVLVLFCTVATAVVVSRAVMSHRRFACCWFRVTRFASWGCSFGVPLYSAPCCVFEVVLNSGRAARSESRTRPVLRVRNLALSVTRPASFRVSVYLYGVTRPTSRFNRSALLVCSCFKRNPENRGVQKRMRRGAEATRGGPYDNTCNHDDSRRQGTSISGISSITTSISGGDPDKRRDYNPSTLRQPLHSQIPKTLRPKSHTDHTCHPLHSQTPSLVEGIPTKGGTITPPYIVNPSTHENPGILHSRSPLKGLTHIPPGGIVQRVGQLKTL